MKKINYAIALSMFEIGFCQAQTTVIDDIVTLKTGEKYEGQIIEQRPGSSITMLRNEPKDTLVFYLDQITSMKKKTRTIKDETPVEVLKETTKVEEKQPTNNYAEEGIYQVGNDLTIFSEDEYKFKVYINGKPFNQNFATRVSLENINHNWARISVLFENPDFGVIEQDIPLSPNDGDLLPYTSTYRVYTSKKGILKMWLFNNSVKKVAPGSANILIHRDASPSNIKFNHTRSVKTSR